jgi:hypothetical protein
MNQRPCIVNIINFIRAVEPRESMDLREPVREQLALLEKYSMRGTFLMQYDALLDSAFIDLLRGSPHEIGIWLEIVEPLARAAGIPWRGRFPWDWHSHVGFSAGYTPGERERLLDCFMEQFRAVWGYYPASAGSWLIDAHSLSYLADKYRISASCNCKEQWGTDGYTLWGGYYGQAYYPSRNNVLSPAQNAANHIPVPVFRMLGSDPVYQYDAGLRLETGAEEAQPVITLEPVYSGMTGGGGRRGWVDWFFDTVMRGCCLSFNYAQIGQENSFGWLKMKDGLLYQTGRLDALAKAGLVRVETLAESGEWYKKQYRETPNSAITALADWKNEGRRSVWFCSKRYRVNFYAEKDIFWLRDLMIFDENYTERYLSDTCKGPSMTYDTLPVIDGNRWSGGGIRAGWFLSSGAGRIPLTGLAAEEAGTDLRLTLSTTLGDIGIVSRDDSISLESAIGDLCFSLEWNKSPEMDSAVFSGRELRLRHEGFAYSVRLEKGVFRDGKVHAENGSLVFRF